LQPILRAIIQSGMPRALLLAALAVAFTAQAQIQVRDDYGHVVTLASPAKRVVSLAPHLTELMYAAGAGSRMVGAVAYSDYPPAARALPRVGSDAAIDLEALIALHPDLVVAWPNSGSVRAVDRIAAMGIPVFRSEPRELEDIARTLETLGRLAGTPDAARATASEFRERVARLGARYAQRPPVRVFYQVWDRPIITVNGDHIISKVIRLCGGRNVMADLPGIAPQIDVERVLRADPEVILASGADASRPAWLDGWKDYPGLAAARLGQLYAIRPDVLQRQPPRLLDGAEEICHIFEAARARKSR